MKIETIKNEKGEVLKTKDGVELKNYKFEAGDEFIPKFNKIITKTYNANINGNIKPINNYSLLCKVRDSKGNIIFNGNDEFIFVSLTPAQFNSLNKKLIAGIEINQKLFSAYNYEITSKDKNGNEVKSVYIGVGFKSEFKPAKDFDDFDVADFESDTLKE